MITSIALTCALASCTPLITSSQDYRTAGARSAGDASTQVAVTAQAAHLAMAGRVFQPYLVVVVSDAEGALNGMQGTFGELQPPSQDDEVTRDTVLELLGEALDEVSAVRVTVTAGRTPTEDQLARLAELQTSLDDLAGQLS